MIYIKKKGMSTLISTVLLVSFAVILGIVIIGWGNRLIQSNIDKGEERIGTDLECLNVNVKITPTSDLDDFKVFVQNNNMKEQEIKGFISRFGIGNKIYVDYKNEGTIIESFGVAVLEYDTAEDRNGAPVGGYDNPSELETIEVIPRVVLDNEEVVDCEKKSAKFIL